MSGAPLGSAGAIAIAAGEPSQIDPDGTLHIRELTIPPSDLWSPEFTRYHADRAGKAADLPPVPARHAHKVEWDKYIARTNARSAELLALARELYPTTVEDTKMAGVRVGIVLPKAGIAPENRQRVLINLRGGGFVYGHGLNAGLLASIPVAAIGRIKVITLDYRQAPFHSYPAATEDVEAVYAKLLKQYKAEAIGIYGCSAGATLTAQAVAWFQTKGLPRPGAVGIHCQAPAPSSARLPYRSGGDSRRWSGDSGMWMGLIPKNRLSEAERNSFERLTWYMEGVAHDDPEAYPGASDAVLAQFPPTLFLTGTRASEMSTVIVAHARFLKLGVDAALYVMEGAYHADHVEAVSTPEAHDAYAYIARWFDQHLAR